MFPHAMVQLVSLDEAMDYSALRLFAGVELAAVEGLLEACPVRSLEAGEVLVEPGQPNDTLYAVLDGTLGVHLDSPDEEPLARIGSGETVVELSVIDDRPTSAFVVAETRARLLAIDREVFWALIGTSHAFSCNMLALLAGRLRANHSAILDNRRLRQVYRRQATTDELTGLANRRWLQRILARQVRRAGMNGEALSAIVIDIDHFRRFNDELGHLAGDHVLYALAQTLKDSVRPTDLLARYGGEEFVVIMPDTDRHGARIVAERIRAAVADTAILMSDESLLPSVTVSLGVAEREDGAGAATLLAAAEQALRRAKAAGRNRTCG
jgi:diguanylate cyclase (GGDEF)-like protein